MLDLSIIKNDRLAVVHCLSEYQADEFLKCLRNHYPSKKFFGGSNNWSMYESDTCYWPNFGDTIGLQYGSLSYAKENNYNVYEYTELCGVTELPAFTAEVDIKSLFGME